MLLKRTNGRVNPITMFLVNNRGITPTFYASECGLNSIDFLATISGIKPKFKISIFLYKHDEEIFNLLPGVAKIETIDKKINKLGKKMAIIKNPITIFLYEKRLTTLSIYARNIGFSPTSMRNTFYGIRPIKKIVLHLYENDREIFNLLPSVSKDKILKEIFYKLPESEKDKFLDCGSK